MKPRSLLPVLLLCSASCGLVTGPDGEGRLRVSADAPYLVLRNTGSEPIYFAAWEQDTERRSLWGPCNDPAQGCPRVEPGEVRRLPYDSVAGYRPGADTALVFWWHLVPKEGGGFLADPLRREALRF